MELRQKPSPLGKVAERSEVGRGLAAVRIRRSAATEATLYCTSPDPFGATLPKGEGMGTVLFGDRDRQHDLPFRLPALGDGGDSGGLDAGQGLSQIV